MIGRSGLVAASLAIVLLVPLAVAGASPAHYVPKAGDQFDYSESILVTNGQGNYSGYTEQDYFNGSIAVTGVQPNGTESASYRSSGTISDSLGQHYPWSESGTFTFSAVTFRYVQGTDNQTGYVNPYVWFYMDNGLAPGAVFYVLNTGMTVVATGYALPLALSSTGYVTSIYAEGNGSYQRNDVYGTFTATYNWKAYFDPGTGYVLGYVYTEVDRDASGDGFTYTDTLTDTQTSFPTTPAASPPPPSSGGGGSTVVPWLAVVLAVLAVGVILVVVAVAVSRRRKAPPRIPQHPTAPARGTMPSYPAPPPVHLIPRDQPLVQQVVLRETVKVPCQYCGTLIDSTATVCPQCGASRT